MNNKNFYHHFEKFFVLNNLKEVKQILGYHQINLCAETTDVETIGDPAMVIVTLCKAVPWEAAAFHSSLSQ